MLSTMQDGELSVVQLLRYGAAVHGDSTVKTWTGSGSRSQSYLAVPAMGAVLHTLNVRMSPAQLTFIANYAEDRVVIVDASLAPLLSKLPPRLETVRHVVVANGDSAAVETPPGVQVHDYGELAGVQPDQFTRPVIDERSAAAICYTSAPPATRRG